MPIKVFLSTNTPRYSRVSEFGRLPKKGVLSYVYSPFDKQNLEEPVTLRRGPHGPARDQPSDCRGESQTDRFSCGRPRERVRLCVCASVCMCVCVFLCVCVCECWVQSFLVQFALQVRIRVFESSLAAIARVHLAAPTQNLNNDEGLWTESHKSIKPSS